jgi:beta-glucosidase/6-phospho-beta-glucosidase/beta-galactosidase
VTPAERRDVSALDALPAVFAWGVATAAHQIEGTVGEGGRSRSCCG